jgi:hypothetical protein
MVNGMEKEAAAIKSDVLSMCWHMRGGLTYSEAMQLGESERRAVGALIKEHMDTTKKTGLPYF